RDRGICEIDEFVDAPQYVLQDFAVAIISGNVGNRGRKVSDGHSAAAKNNHVPAGIHELPGHVGTDEPSTSDHADACTRALHSYFKFERPLRRIAARQLMSSFTCNANFAG